MRDKAAQIRIGISIGDINGVGVELLLRSYTHSYLFEQGTPVVFSDPWVLNSWIEHLQLEDIELNVIKDTDQAKPGVLNVVPINAGKFELQIGTSQVEAGAYAFQSLQNAVDAVSGGKVHNLLTLPINKHNIQSDKFDFAGHTEYLAEQFQTNDHMMILAGDQLRVGVLTGHIPLQEVSSKITKESLHKTLSIFSHSLINDFQVRKPKIAVLGLNPHSGDNGLIGSEEQNVIIPVISELIEDGQLIYGPYPADGFFGTGKYKEFDGVLAMYHDQGLIPFKQLAFADGVNYTAGLPTVRTSPDHGTAYDIAGTGKASVESVVHAIYLNAKIYLNRLEQMDLTKEPLEYSTFKREKFSIGVPNLK